MCKFRIHYTNFDYYAAQDFAVIESAIAYGKSKCFEFTVWRGDELIASWSPIGGLREHVKG